MASYISCTSLGFIMSIPLHIVPTPSKPLLITSLSQDRVSFTSLRFMDNFRDPSIKQLLPDGLQADAVGFQLVSCSCFLLDSSSLLKLALFLNIEMDCWRHSSSAVLHTGYVRRLAILRIPGMIPTGKESWQVLNTQTLKCFINHNLWEEPGLFRSDVLTMSWITRGLRDFIACGLWRESGSWSGVLCRYMVTL